MSEVSWRLPMGANVVADGVAFRVWAPAARRVEVEILARDRPRYHALEAQADGWFHGLVADVGAGTRYRYRLDGGSTYPDPCSRAQPDGVHGPSLVVDPNRYRWRDRGWQGVARDDLVIYELHVGAYTPEGTFDALIAQLPHLRWLGITAIELMPVAEFPGRWNWGYDGVDLYAPSWRYGGPEGLRRLVDAAHEAGLAVLLDVVYNHLGPDGNYLRAYSPHYFTDRYHTPWGDALDFDGPASGAVRDFVVENACYWLVEYHLDGLRLDATHAIFDRSPKHLLAELNERVRAAVGPDRRVVLIAEHEETDRRTVLSPEHGGYGLDGVWADDFHHAVHTLLTGERDGYYRRYPRDPNDVVRAVIQGAIPDRRPRRAIPPASSAETVPESRSVDAPAIPSRAFVFCVQNHDQVGNRAFGERLNHLIAREHYLVASALLILVPETPLVFMGQEFAASSPFLYFTDHHPELGRLVTEGRRREFAAFAAFRDPARRAQIPDPQDPATFQRSKLDLGEREVNADVLGVYRDLLELRRTDPVLRAADGAGAALGPRLIAFWRWQGDEHRLLLFNFGDAVAIDWHTDAFLARLPTAQWEVVLQIGAAPTTGDRLDVPATSAAVLRAAR